MARGEGGGRPKAEVNEAVLFELAKIHCTIKEMAAVLKVSEDTLERRQELRAIIEQGKEEGKSSLRRLIWKNAEKGNNIAMKYLIHNILKERIEEPQQAGVSVVNVLTPQEEEAKKGIIEYLKSRK